LGLILRGKLLGTCIRSLFILEIIFMKIRNYENRSESIRLPDKISVANQIVYPNKTNILINDTNSDSFEILAALLPNPLPNVKEAGRKQRQIEIWDAKYLTEQLASEVIKLEDLEKRCLVPVSGDCGTMVAKMLQNELIENYGIELEIASSNESITCSAIVVDDVLKTGQTIFDSMPKSITESQETVYAVWAMSSVSEDDLLYDWEQKYSALRCFLSDDNNQRIIAGIAYSGKGVSALGLPVNSLSTISISNENQNKREIVLANLAERYFGEAIYIASEIVSQSET